MKSEFYFNIQANDMVEEGNASVKILNTSTKWFGVTYREDRPMVLESLNNLVEAGVYPKSLWA